MALQRRKEAAAASHIPTGLHAPRHETHPINTTIMFGIVTLFTACLVLAMCGLFLLRGTHVSFRPPKSKASRAIKAATAPPSSFFDTNNATTNALESAEWLSILIDKFYHFMHAEMAEDLKRSLTFTALSKLEEKGYARSAVLDVVSFGDSLPRVSSIDLVKSTSCAVTLDLSVEYASNMNIGFAADVPIARGRLLPCGVRVRDLSINARCRVSLSSVSLADDLDTPVVVVDVACLEEPSFSFELDTAIGGKYCLRNFLLFPFIVKRLLRKVISKKCVYPNVITKKFPLPKWAMEPPQDFDEEGEEEEDTDESTVSSGYESSAS